MASGKEMGDGSVDSGSVVSGSMRGDAISLVGGGDPTSDTEVSGVRFGAAVGAGALQPKRQTPSPHISNGGKPSLQSSLGARPCLGFLNDPPIIT